MIKYITVCIFLLSKYSTLGHIDYENSPFQSRSLSLNMDTQDFNNQLWRLGLVSTVNRSFINANPHASFHKPYAKRKSSDRKKHLSKRSIRRISQSPKLRHAFQTLTHRRKPTSERVSFRYLNPSYIGVLSTGKVNSTQVELMVPSKHPKINSDVSENNKQTESNIYLPNVDLLESASHVSILKDDHLNNRLRVHQPMPTALPLNSKIPDITWGKEESHTSAAFADPNPINVTARDGEQARLPCTVMHLGKGQVSWIRKRDLHILTVGRATYTSDQRFKVLHGEGSLDWTLIISSTTQRDAGVFECQVSTKPKISRPVNLIVAIERAEIQGPSEIFIRNGSTISLTCIVMSKSEDLGSVVWTKEGVELDYDSPRGGISLEVEKTPTRSTTKLFITKARRADSGFYICSPHFAQPASIRVHVVNGEESAAVQTSHAVSLPWNKSFILFYINLLIYFHTYIKYWKPSLSHAAKLFFFCSLHLFKSIFSITKTWSKLFFIYNWNKIYHQILYAFNVLSFLSVQDLFLFHIFNYCFKLFTMINCTSLSIFQRSVKMISWRFFPRLFRTTEVFL